ITGLDLRALDEVSLVQERRDPGDNADAIGGLNSSQKLVRLGDRPFHRLHDADGRGAGSAELGICGWGSRKRQHAHHENSSHSTKRFYRTRHFLALLVAAI